MTNPFASAVAETPAAPAETKMSVEEARQTVKDGIAETGGRGLGIGDPFAAPIGIGDGERITDFVGRLLLIKPTEYIREMNTTQGKTDAVRIDAAVLDDETDPGKIVIGVLLFQQALKREAKAILDGDLPYLLGRLHKGTTAGGKNTLYTFQAPTDDEADLARKWLKLGGKL